jgi:hypothetical protein
MPPIVASLFTLVCDEPVTGHREVETFFLPSSQSATTRPQYAE